MLKLRKNKKGFTLVELIVVIAIMAVLAGTIAGVTVSQLNKQTNNTAKSEAQTLASDLYNFMIDYKLSGDISTTTLKAAVDDFISENNQTGKIVAAELAADGTVPSNNDQLKDAVNGASFKAGEHQFYAVVYQITTTVGQAPNATTTTNYYVRFCCLQKGNGNNQFPFADYTYGEVLAD